MIRTRWIMLQLLSLLSFVTLFPALFSAVPLILLRLEAGRRTYAILVLSSNILLTTYFVIATKSLVGLNALYMMVCWWATVASELLLKFFPQDDSPVENDQTDKKSNNFWTKYWVYSSLPLLLVIIIMIGLAGDPSTWIAKLQNWASVNVINAPTTQEILAELKKTGAPEAEQSIKLLESPELMAKQLLFLMPSYMLACHFLFGFFTLFFIPRIGQMVDSRLNLSKLYQGIATYRNPDWSIVLVIIILAWALFYDALPIGAFWKENGALLGSGLINTIGVFFFFQGFMVLIHLFNRWKINGIFRTLALVLAFILALRLVVLLGLVDMWFDFRAKKTVTALKQ